MAAFIIFAPPKMMLTYSKNLLKTKDCYNSMIDILKGSTAGQGRKTSWMKWINKALTARTGSNIDNIQTKH